MYRKIAIIGPECTGKTTLANQLADHFLTVWIPEYARTYVENLTKPYTYEDVEKIAALQFKQIKADYLNANKFIFFDTELIITKVWFDIVFGKIPGWLDNAIKESGFSVYLLCDTSLPWVPDKVRENGGEMRKILFDSYKQNLEMYGFKYYIITGVERERTSNAIKFVNQLSM